MPLDPSYVGRSYGPTAPYEVCVEKIREFATAIGAADPAYHDPAAAAAAGHPSVVAPPTFPVVFTAGTLERLAEDPGFGLDFSRVVHGEQRFAYARPVHAGDELTCRTTIEEINHRAGNDFLGLRTEVTDAGGEGVVTVWSKIVVRGEE